METFLADNHCGFQKRIVGIVSIVFYQCLRIGSQLKIMENHFEEF